MIEETWSPESVKAWRYWSLSELYWNFDMHRWDVQLQGNVQPWEGPAKLAGYHMEEGHESPFTGCACGINAVKAINYREILHRGGVGCGCAGCAGCAPSWFWGGLTKRPVVVGEVQLSGVVDEYETGYRASQAEIVKLVLIGGTTRLGIALNESYGVPVMLESFDGLFLQKLRQEEANGHREADTPDHRGTGTGQSAGASEGTGEGWRKVKKAAANVGAFLVLLLGMTALIAFLTFVVYGLMGGFDPEKILALKAPWVKMIGP